VRGVPKVPRRPAGSTALPAGVSARLPRSGGVRRLHEARAMRDGLRVSALRRGGV